MFTTVERVKEVTGYDVTIDGIIRAQYVIMSYIGRTEADVIDPTDRSILSDATSYQAAYMANDAEKIYEQVSLVQIAQFGQAMTLTQDGVTPWIAPMAKIACQRLSWKRMRSVKTGGLFHIPAGPRPWEVD